MIHVPIRIPDLCTLAGYPAPVVSEVDGHHVLTFTCSDTAHTLQTAQAVTRELIKFRQDKDVRGTREGNQIVFTFAVPGAALPEDWRLFARARK